MISERGTGLGGSVGKERERERERKREARSGIFSDNLSHSLSGPPTILNMEICSASFRLPFAHEYIQTRVG